MPSPVAHALAGLTVHVLTARDVTEARDRVRGLWITGAAVAPDVDLLFRFVDGRNHHDAQTHSIGFALLAALAAVVVSRLLRRPRALALGGAVGLGWLSHLLLDYLNLDTHPPIGIMALWPFGSGYYKFPWPFFLDIGRTLEWATVRHDALAVAWELAVLLPILALTWRWRFRPAS